MSAAEKAAGMSAAEERTGSKAAQQSRPGRQPAPVEVRSAADLPIEQLLDWRMEVIRCVFELPADADLSDLRARNRAYYETTLADGTHLPCLAYVDGRPAGCGALCLQREMPSPDNPSGRNAYLMNIYTRPDARGHGVGRAVASWLVAQAREHGAGKIYLETTPAGRPLYESLGFADLPDMMETRRSGRVGRAPAGSATT